jgi:G6PDH family F420-dependent oxidoreductase
MAEVGLFLASEEHPPDELLRQARMAADTGVRSVLISDHFHPWLDRQGQSPFVWSVIGGIAATTDLKVTTGVTCPTTRLHPVIVAHAAATSQLMLDGRFVLGVGSGEALNEHVLGHRWPPVATRLEMLEEAIDVMRQLWQGSTVTHHGRYYAVENARLYSLPAQPPPIAVSAFGDASLSVAARVGDALVTTRADRDLVDHYRSQGGSGPVIGALKVCWGNDETSARKQAHSLWATECLPGQLNQELPMPSNFEDASTLVSEEMVAEKIACGPDPERHLAAISAFVDSGFDEVYVNQIGPDQQGFLRFYDKELRRRLRA